VLAAFRQLSTDSVRRLEATGHAVPADFADMIVRGVLTALPTPEVLRDRLSLRYRVGVIQLGSELLAEQRRAAEERRRIEAIEEERQSDVRRRAAEDASCKSSCGRSSNASASSVWP
jgi:hypothetical protein